MVNLNSHEEDQMIEINGKLRKKHVISTYSPFNGSYENRCIIEGIGCDGNFVGSFPGVYNTLIVYCDCSRTRGLARVIGPDGQVEYRGWYDQIGPAAISATTHDYPITISAADGMILVTSQPSASGTVEVINMAGQVVSRLIVDGVRQMSTRPLPKGAYVVQYYDGIIRKTQKVSL